MKKSTTYRITDDVVRSVHRRDRVRVDVGFNLKDVVMKLTREFCPMFNIDTGEMVGRDKTQEQMKIFTLHDNNDFCNSTYGLSIDDVDDMILSDDELHGTASYDVIHNLGVDEYVNTLGWDYTLTRIE